MSEKIKKFKTILKEKLQLKKRIATQIRENTKTQRRLYSLIRTAERKKYIYRPELVVVEDWIKRIGNDLRGIRKENNKQIFVGKGLIDLASLSYLREVIDRNPHIDY